MSDGVVKTLHLLRCIKFSIISKYLLYVEMIENLRAAKLKFFYLAIADLIFFHEVLMSDF
jgi:hypothetical protein